MNMVNYEEANKNQNLKGYITKEEEDEE